MRTYTPKNTKDYEDLIKESFIKQCGENVMLDSNIEIGVTITAYFKPPKSTSKKLSEQLISNQIGYMHKPDSDNIAKTVLDALNGVAYKDDSQVTELTVYKYYGNEDKLIVEIKNL